MYYKKIVIDNIKKLFHLYYFKDNIYKNTFEFWSLIKRPILSVIIS